MGKSTICRRLAGTVPGAVLLDADIFGYQHVNVAADEPDLAAFWRWLAEVAHEIAQNNLVVTYFSVMLREQLLENAQTLEYFASVHFLYLTAPPHVLRERIVRQAGTIGSPVDINAYVDERTTEWNAFNGRLHEAAAITPNTTAVDATRPASEVEREVRDWINSHLGRASVGATA